MVGAIAARAGLRIISAGMPNSKQRRLAPDAALIDGAEPISDLRAALATSTIRAAILAMPAASVESPSSDPDLLRLVRSRSITLLSFEPIPASVADSREAEAGQWLDACRFLGLFRAAPALATVHELLESFGTPRTLTVSFRSGKGQGSLGARLYDAMHTVHSILGVPESIDASIITQVATSGLRLEPGEALRHLHGDLTANLRYAGAKSAALSLSDRAGRWFRGVALVGESGCIRMDESGVERNDADGQVIEKSPVPRKKSASKAGALFEDIIDAPALEALAESARRAMDPRAPKPEPFDLEAVLSMCEAAILSARTGQPESPATVVRMA
jgi:hypothetical protein